MQERIGSLIIAVAFISYGIYCLIKGGTHHKDVGWVSKEESQRVSCLPWLYIFPLEFYQFFTIFS